MYRSYLIPETQEIFCSTATISFVYLCLSTMHPGPPRTTNLQVLYEGMGSHRVIGLTFDSPCIMGGPGVIVSVSCAILTGQRLIVRYLPGTMHCYGASPDFIIL
jgi:hypothetical protein